MPRNLPSLTTRAQGAQVRRKEGPSGCGKGLFHQSKRDERRHDNGFEGVHVGAPTRRPFWRNLDDAYDVTPPGSAQAARRRRTIRCARRPSSRPRRPRPTRRRRTCRWGSLDSRPQDGGPGAGTRAYDDLNVEASPAGAGRRVERGSAPEPMAVAGHRRDRPGPSGKDARAVLEWPGRGSYIRLRCALYIRGATPRRRLDAFTISPADSS